MRQHLDQLYPSGHYLVWAQAAIDNGQYTTSFYYQCIIDCVGFLIHHVTYRRDMVQVYVPVQEYNSSEEGLYSKIHTADWWWDTQL